MSEHIKTIPPRSALDKANSIAKTGENIVILAGIIHIIIVWSNLLFPDLLAIEMDTLRGSLMGILFLWLSLGIRRRNRVIAIITLIAWATDTLLKYVLNSGIASGPLFIRAGLAIGLFIGIVGCFMFRSVQKSNRDKEAFSKEIIESIPPIDHARIIIFSALSIVGLGAFVSELYRILI